MTRKREISIFIDESGELSAPCRPDSCRDAFYIVSLVFHNQETDLSSLIGGLNHDLVCMDLPGIDEHHALHSYNLIRGEEPYQSFPLQDRRRLFNRSVDFACQCARIGISADVLVLDRRSYLSGEPGPHGLRAIREGGRDDMERQVREWLTGAISAHRSELGRYDTVKIYYDNGQDWLARLIHDVLRHEVVEDELQFKKDVDQAQYKLLQVADLMCTNALLQRKLAEAEDFTNNDVAFFRSSGRAKKRNRRKTTQPAASGTSRPLSEAGSKIQILGKRLSALLRAPIPRP